MTFEKCCTCKHAFTSGENRWYCKKSLSDKDDCGEYESYWIPVREKMPEDRQNVLFCDIDGDIMLGYHVKGRPITHFTQDGSFDDIKDVKAWMSLPGPYKTESEGCKITTEMDLKNMIAESREVAKALIGFANELERIEKKYAKPQEKNENGMSLCDRCIHNNVCGAEGIHDPAMTYCSDFLGWTHVSEDMPKDGQHVLFCDIDGDIMLGYHVKGRPDTHFTQDGSFDDIKNVRAWMKRPKPYKTESEEKNA